MAKRAYIHDDFLLESDEAVELYHEHAASLPIIDYHCHLPPDQIAGDRRFENIGQAWLEGDHYKWRAMRANGIDEKYCAGEASYREKFDKWAATMPYLVRNQLYAWTQLELVRFFGVYGLLGPATAEKVWTTCNEKLAKPEFSARGLMKQSGVELVCTTDDPTDSLEHHKKIAEDASFDIRVLPTWRPDRAMAVENAAAFNAWADKLGAAADIEIRDFSSYMEALRKRHEVFHAMGCRVSDHGLEQPYAEDYAANEIDSAFLKLRSGGTLDSVEAAEFKAAMLFELGVMDWEKHWVQQYHFGVLRNVNTRMFKRLGADTGFDSIGDFEIARPLAKLLDRLERTNALAKTIVYNINPRDNDAIVTVLGSFQDGSEPGRMQFGTAWWLLDHKDGMERQMKALSNTGLLSRFVGMVTDSRSFLSYPRHEYFRRVLCNMLGGEMRAGIIPNDAELVGRMVEDICYGNAVRYFGFGE